MLIRALAVLPVAVAAACSEPSAPPLTSSTSTSREAPVSTPSPRATSGTHFAAARTYQGECAPPGSRGGCHTLTLRPDGTYRNVLYDMVIDGRYTVAGATVTLHGPIAGEDEVLPLSADGRTLGELTLRP